jgi:hypothetical protein
MGYRIKEHRPPLARRTVVDLATPAKLYVHNGATSEFAFPCYYQEVLPPIPARRHNRRFHDHVGWPSPGHADHCCQIALVPHQCGHKGGCKTCRHYLDAGTIFPIHLLSELEGYSSSIDVALYAPDEFIDLEGLNVSAWVDEEEDWVVRMLVSPRLSEAISEPVRIRFTLFANSAAHTLGQREYQARRDIVGIGEIIICPSQYDQFTS